MNEKKKLWRLPKRILSFVLTLAMVLTLMPTMSVEVKAEDGTCGCSNHTYLIDGDTITINGSESITSSCGFDSSSSVSQDKNVIIGDDITEVGNYAFEMCEIKSITFGSSVNTIGEHICCANGELIVTFTSVVENIDEYAFSSCSEGTLNLPADWPETDLPDEDGKWYGGTFPSYTPPTPPTPPTKYEIILQDNGNGYADSRPENEAVEGADVTITANAYPDYVFDKWESSDITIPDTAGREYTFTMPAKNETVKAVFKAAHTHDWQYSATGNKLEAYCANAGCPSDTDADNKVSLTLTATSANYSGNTAADAVTMGVISADELTAWTDAGATVPTFAYYEADADNSTVRKNDTPVTSFVSGTNYVVEATIGEEKAVKAFRPIILPDGASWIDDTHTTWWDWDTDTKTLTFGGEGELPDYTRFTPSTRPWHSQIEEATAVIFKDGISRIGNYVMYRNGSNSENHSPLLTISLPYTLQSIGESAFFGSNSVTSLTLDIDNLVLEDGAFYGLTNLATLNITGENIIIGRNAFKVDDDENSLNVIAIAGNGVTIGETAFSCRRPRKIVISGDDATLGNEALGDLYHIEEIEFAGSGVTVEGSIFSENTVLENLTKITFSHTASALSSSAFNGIGPMTVMDFFGMNINNDVSKEDFEVEELKEFYGEVFTAYMEENYAYLSAHTDELMAPYGDPTVELILPSSWNLDTKDETGHFYGGQFKYETDNGGSHDIKTVTYNANGHGTAPDSIEVISGEKLTPPANPTASGYTFAGWYKEAACTNAWVFDTDTVTGNITLYAKWNQNSGGGGGYIPPSNPDNNNSGNNNSGNTITVPVENGSQSSKVTIEVKDNVAVVDTINDDVIKDTVEKGTTDTITIDASAANTDVHGTALDKQTAEKIADVIKDTSNKVENLEIKTPQATITLDGTALQTVADAAGAATDLITLVVDDVNNVMKELTSVQQNAIKDTKPLATFDAYILAGKSRVHNLKGGVMTVAVEYPFPNTVPAKDVKLVHMLNDGGTEVLEWKVVTENGKKLAVFKTKSLSYFIFTLDENGVLADADANALTMNAALKVSQTGSRINVSWGKVKAADGYVVYAAYCGKKLAKIETIADADTTSLEISKLDGKKLDLKKNYKVRVVAYKLVDGKKTRIGKTIIAHVAGRKNTKYTNAKSIKLTSADKVTLKAGKTAKIKATIVPVNAEKKQLSDAHAKEFRYASSDTSIATVDANGKITAKKEGKCTIYVYAKNGYAKKVTVTVK